MARRTMALLGSLALAASMVAVPTLATAAPPEGAGRDPARAPVVESDTGSYVVLMEGAPLALDEGAARARNDRGRARGQQMRASHRRAAQDAGVQIVNQYTAALNGFSAVMSHDQAQKLAARDDVTAVLPDVMRQPTTDASGDFLGLSGEGGAHATGLDGEGVVVGVIDTGIWPEHPSFADDGTYPEPPVQIEDTTVTNPVTGATEPLPGCDFGNTAHNPEDAPFTCNDKLIGARQMLQTYRTLTGAEPSEFDSARDDDGHGTHTASTAAGNADVPAQVNGHDLGTVTGIAPRAHVVMYKGLGALGGYSSDLAAAIDQAVEDGVDVINYSIGGGASLTGADDLAFLFAAAAGVHVATSAGNSGPGAGTVGGPGSVPWLTTVGASTQPRFFSGTVRLGNGAEYVGASLTESLDGPARLVDAEDVSRDGSDLCEPGNLVRGQVRGAIVLCRRGAIARVDKSLAVAQAGGVGMVMYENDDSGDRFTDNHHVPSVHVDHSDGLAMKAYIDEFDQPGSNNRGRARTATASIVDTGSTSEFSPAPSMTSFSSRGPDVVAEDLIKPDVTAPGMQVLAGASPYADPNGNDFQSIAGTSMSSPHVAGLMALLDQAHDDWSPAAVKSALMTTAHQDVRDNDRTTLAGPFARGAGHVDPGLPGSAGSAFDPGLVFEAGPLEYVGFLCDTEPAIAEALVGGTSCDVIAGAVPVEATDLNVPSIGMSEVPGSKTVTRTVTNVADTELTMTAVPDAPDGFMMDVEPDQLTVPAGESASFTVTVDTTDAPLGEWRFGSLTWTGGGYDVYSPVAVRGVAFEAPAEIDGSGEEAGASFDVAFGYEGAYAADGHGLVPATVHTDVVQQDPDQTFAPGDVGTGANAYEITTNGSAHLRLAIPPDAVSVGAADIDLFVYDSAGNEVASSTNGGTDEVIDLALPADDTYTAYVHGWNTGEPSAEVSLYVWDVSADAQDDDGSLAVDSAPASASLGASGTVEVSWSGATAGSWYLGAVSHRDGSGLLGLTLVNLDNRAT